MILKKKKYSFSSLALVMLSALLYPIPFYFPYLFFWISFLYLVPVFYAAIAYALSWRVGFLWGLIALTLHEMAVYQGLFCMASGTWYIKITLLVLIILYRAAYVGLWFGIAGLMQKKLPPTLFWALGVWVVSAWLYELWMERCHMCPFGRVEGLLFFSPLLPLAAYPSLLIFLPLLGEKLLLLLLFIAAGLLTYAVTKQRIWPVLAVVIIWSWGFIVNKKIQLPVWVSRMGVVQEQFVTAANKPAILQLHDACARLVQKKPEITCIICPESCLYDHDCALSFATYQPQTPSFANLQLIFGGFCSDAALDHAPHAQRNTAYFLHANGELAQYDKRHALPFTERVPRFYACLCVSNLFFSQRLPIAHSTNSRPLWHIAGHQVVPYICSELFFNAYPDDAYREVTILALCNDAWVNSYGRQMMLLAARFRAISWQRDCLYVSYHHGYYISRYGKLKALSSLN